MRKLLLLTILFLTWRSVPVGAQGTVTLNATAGFDGYYRAGTWVPVHITVANTGADAEGEVQIVAYSDWRGKVTYTRSLSLPNRSRKQFLMYVHVGGYTHEITVKLSYVISGNTRQRNAVSTTVNLQPLDSQDLLCVVLSDDPASLHYLAGLPPVGQRRVYLTHMQVDELPTQADALSGVDVLVIRNADTGKLTPKQREALRGWVALGGHLIVCGGA
ncbi:MAG: hypothetical protein Q9M13_07590, partial [Mariprofundales bacterium]|nr:hypothetical protein [Mariprofundales bacterium]